MHRLLALLVIPASLAIATTSAVADTAGADPNDPGKITAIAKGVKEIDLGGIFVLNTNKVGDGDSVTNISTLLGPSFQYYFNANVSVGGTVLFNFEKAGDDSVLGFGGLLHASFHMRLGLGAFFRPTAGVGALFGTRDIADPAMPGTVSKLSQSAFLTRISFPIAYFTSRRFLLQAGPEINISLGSFKPDSGPSTSFTTISGGFSVGLGYVF